VFLSRLRRAAIERLSDHDVRWRSLGALFVAGGLLADLMVLLPVDRGSNSIAILGLGVFAMGCGAFLVVAAARLPRHDGWLSGFLALGTVLITLAIIANRTAASPLFLIYVWVGFDGFFFLNRRHAFAHLGWVGINYAIALSVTPAHGLAEGGRWLMLMGTVGVIGALADVLRSRSEELIGQLSEVARTDSLTSLLNRRGFEERIADELHRARRNGGAVSLVVGDLDHFKAINDRYGHHVGDEALRAFAQLVVQTKRVIDGAARIGGEEFALVLPDTDEHGAYLLAERMRRRVRQAPPGSAMPTSVSFGIASFPRDADDADNLLRHADQSLYVAKRLGRDRSVIYSPEVAAGFSPASDGGEALDQLPAVLVLA
jgi:diguanylate cyclase (GGDEF)-like protein